MLFNKITHPLIRPKSACISLNIISSNKAEQQTLVRETYSVTAIQRAKESIHFSNDVKQNILKHTASLWGALTPQS